ncbi:hydroxymethylbilane synthase [Buchnera aphidicola (Mindarus keteleerifoliae)]|uniref:hydroxymethylbilane synthase n=1 Tax=Buchnera aphidicola TaxID=9 RepID=UPI0031B6A0FB
MLKKKIRIATRKSPLALFQAMYVKKKLISIFPNLLISIIPIATHGDKFLDSSFIKNNGKGVFIKELELALIQNKVDIAIHSVKDIPMVIHKNLSLACICKRINPLDALVSKKYENIDQLPKNAIIGTSSLRRKFQLINYRQDLIFSPLRGNIETRLKKLDKGKYDAIILAAAGLKRLGLKKRISYIIPPELSLPPCGQGAIGIECRLKDKKIINILKKIHHYKSKILIQTERAFCKKLSIGCQLPVGSFAILKKGKIWLRTFVSSTDGKKIMKGEKIGSFYDAKKIGCSLASEFLKSGVGKILNQ